MFTSMMQDFTPRMTMLLGTRTASDETLDAIRRQVAAIGGGTDREHDVLRTLDSYLAATALAPERIATVLTAAAAAIALGLGILGLSGAMADTARMRRRETALRVTLGAPQQPIPWSVWVMAAATLLAAVAVASVFPARDAMAVAPLSIMRNK